MTRVPGRRHRRGNYVLLLAGSVVLALGLGAMSVDVPYMMMAHGEGQGTVDAAAQAALITLRRSGDPDAATAAAQSVLAANAIAGTAPGLVSLTYGTWDDTAPLPTWSPGALRPNAVRLEAGRTGAAGVDYLMARFWGYTSFDVSAHAVAAARSVQVAFVLDVSPSWTQADFAAARNGMVDALDALTFTASPGDQVALAVFHSRYAWAMTPWTGLASDVDALAVHDQWAALNVASRAGTDADPADMVDCTYNAVESQDDFTSPSGGCYPDMPRAYVDEAGVDPSTGLRAAEQLFGASSAASRFRAVIVITGHDPVAVPADAGTQRAAEPFTDTRWSMFDGGADHTLADIRTDSAASAGRLWSGTRAHTWVVALHAADELYPAVSQGDGYATHTTDAAHVSAVLRQIVGEFPLAIVE